MMAKELGASRPVFSPGSVCAAAFIVTYSIYCRLMIFVDVRAALSELSIVVVIITIITLALALVLISSGFGARVPGELLTFSYLWGISRETLRRGLRYKT